MVVKNQWRRQGRGKGLGDKHPYYKNKIFVTYELTRTENQNRDTQSRANVHAFSTNQNAEKQAYVYYSSKKLF